MGRHFKTNISDQQETKVLFEMTELALSESSSLISSLAQTNVKFTVDSIGVQHKNKMTGLLKPGEPDMLAVCHPVEGDNSANIVFFLEELLGLVFTKKMLNDEYHLKELSEMEEEALTEMGNIIINSILSHYVQFLNKTISTRIPVLKRGHYVQLLDELTGGSDDKEIYFVEFTVEIASHEFRAYILWIDYLCESDTTQSTDSQTVHLKG